MAILLTGGTGKTSIRLAHFLQDAKIPFILASRKAQAGAPSGMQAVKFDWLDSSTFENPFQGATISAVYLIAPEVADPATSMNAFVDHASQKHGVKRFVLLGGSVVTKGGIHVGKVWEHLVESGLEYAILRPSWFMENLSEQPQYSASIKDEGKIYTSCEDGKIPFISATDIAAVAFHSLVDEKPPNDAYRILGPELLTYDEIATKLSNGLGREIVHVKLSEDEGVQQKMKAGLPGYYAKLLTSIEIMAANGQEAELKDDAVERITGKPPQSFDSWVQENKMAWS